MTIKNIGYFCVSMLKKNKTKYLFQNENKTLCQIYNSLKKRPGRSKYLASAQIVLEHKDFEKPIPAIIVFVRDRSNKKKWCALISTDVSLSEEQIIELYGKYDGIGYLHNEKYDVFNVEKWEILYPIKRDSFFDKILPNSYLSIYDMI